MIVKSTDTFPAFSGIWGKNCKAVQDGVPNSKLLWPIAAREGAK
jgi:hypothetical protein